MAEAPFTHRDEYIEMENPSTYHNQTQINPGFVEHESLLNSDIDVGIQPDPYHLLQNMPSRQLSMKFRHRLSKKDENSGMSKILNKMGRHYGELQDTFEVLNMLLKDNDFKEQSFDDQTKEIRSWSVPLCTKRKLRDRIKNEHSDITNYTHKKLLKDAKDKARTIKTNFTITRLSKWEKIRKKFGTGVASYFEFAQFIYSLNIGPSIFLAILIIFQVNYGWKNDWLDIDFHGLDLLTGGGWFTQTVIYYGNYNNTSFDLGGGHSFDMPLAYLLLCGIYYLMTLIQLLYELTTSFKTHYIELSGHVDFKFAVKIINGWDYNITDEYTAKIMQQGILKDFQEYLEKHKKNEEVVKLANRLSLYFLRVSVYAVVIATIIGCVAAVEIVYTHKFSSILPQDWVSQHRYEFEILEDIKLPVIVTLINYVAPFLFTTMMERLEKYDNPRIEMYTSLGRAFVLNVSTLSMLMYLWMNTVDCDQCEMIPMEDGNSTTGVNPDSNLTTVGQSMLPITEQPLGMDPDCSDDCKPCWENYMGQQLLVLVIMDFFYNLLFFIYEFFRRCLNKYLGNLEFNIERNTLYLIYGQTLVWLGVFYCPVLPYINLLKHAFFLIAKAIAVPINFTPAKKPWRAGHTKTVFYILLTSVLMASIFAISYSVVHIQPSASCGPYQGLESPYSYIFDKLYEDPQRTWPKELIAFVTSNELLVAVLVALGTIAYYLWVRSRGYQKMVASVKTQIKLEGEDRTFVSNVLKQLQNKRDDSHANNHGHENSNGHSHEQPHEYPNANEPSQVQGMYRKRGQGDGSGDVRQRSKPSDPPASVPLSQQQWKGEGNEALNPGYADVDTSPSAPNLPYPVSSPYDDPRV